MASPTQIAPCKQWIQMHGDWSRWRCCGGMLFHLCSWPFDFSLLATDKNIRSRARVRGLGRRTGSWCEALEGDGVEVWGMWGAEWISSAVTLYPFYTHALAWGANVASASRPTISQPQHRLRHHISGNHCRSFLLSVLITCSFTQGVLGKCCRRPFVTSLDFWYL